MRSAAMLLTCSACAGLGWERSAPRALDAFPDACRACAGASVLTLGELARRIDPYGDDDGRRIEAALRRVHKGRTIRSATGERLLALLDLAGFLPRMPPKQVELCA